jgi:Cu/Zn superoxide dismutase
VTLEDVSMRHYSLTKKKEIPMIKKMSCFVFALFAFSFLAGCGDDGTTTTPTATSTTTSFTAKINGTQEFPAPTVTTTATGTGAFSLNAAKTELTFEITVTNLTGAITAAHIHNAAAGLTGIPVTTVNFTNNTASGAWKSTDSAPLTAALVTELEAGRLYLNIHTAANGAGEIRGQITSIASGSKGFTSKVKGDQEVPTVSTTAMGTGAFALNAAKSELTFDITATGLSGPITGAHIHNAAAGVNGGVALVLSFTNNTASGTWKSTDGSPFTADIASKLVAGTLYVNIHTDANPGGEIRGQILANP